MEEIKITEMEIEVPQIEHYSKDEKFLGNLTSHNRIIQVFP